MAFNVVPRREGDGGKREEASEGLKERKLSFKARRVHQSLSTSLFKQRRDNFVRTNANMTLLSDRKREKSDDVEPVEG